MLCWHLSAVSLSPPVLIFGNAVLCNSHQPIYIYFHFRAKYFNIPATFLTFRRIFRKHFCTLLSPLCTFAQVFTLLLLLMKKKKKSVFREKRAAHDFPGELAAAWRDQPVSTPGLLSADLFLLTPPPFFADARHEKCNTENAAFVPRARRKPPERTCAVQWSCMFREKKNK